MDPFQFLPQWFGFLIGEKFAVAPCGSARAQGPDQGSGQGRSPSGWARIGDWTLFCPEAKDKTKPVTCTLEQLLVDAATKKVAFHLATGYGPRGNLILILRAPLGIALVRGLEVTFGGQAVQRARFSTCKPNGCQAVLILSPALQQEMRKAERSLITVYGPDGEPFLATASLKSFGEAVDALNKPQAPP